MEDINVTDQERLILGEQFDLEMKKIYEDAKKLKPPYYANDFLKMINRDGGIKTAQKLLLAIKPAKGFTELWERKALHLSVEYLVLQDKWKPLFSDEQRIKARKNLRDVHFFID